MTKVESKTSSKHQRSPKRSRVDENQGNVGKTEEPSSKAELMRRQRAADLGANKIASSSAAAPRKVTRKELELKRAAILDDRADTKLGMKDKAVFQYRKERQQQYWLQGHNMSEEAFNVQYDAEQFTSVQELLEEGNNNNNGHGSAEQERR